MPNAYYWWQGGREGGQKSQKPAYVIHGCSLMKLISDEMLIFSGSFGVVWIIEITDPVFRQE